MMIKGNDHGNKENEMGDQNGHDQHGCFLCRLITGQQGSGGISQDEQGTGATGRHQDHPGNEIDGHDAEHRGGQIRDHAVSVITNPFGQGQGTQAHATTGEPKDRGDTKDKCGQKGPSMKQVINVVFECGNVTAVMERSRPIGSGLQNHNLMIYVECRNMRGKIKLIYHVSKPKPNLFLLHTKISHTHTNK